MISVFSPVTCQRKPLAVGAAGASPQEAAMDITILVDREFEDRIGAPRPVVERTEVMPATRVAGRRAQLEAVVAIHAHAVEALLSCT